MGCGGLIDAVFVVLTIGGENGKELGGIVDSVLLSRIERGILEVYECLNE